MNFMGCKIRTFLKSLFSLWCGYRQDVNMENGENQICSTFGEKDKKGKEKSCLHEVIDFCPCVSPKSGHKRDVRCKGGSYVVHGGDKVSMAPLK